MHVIASEIVLSTNFFVKNARYALVNNTNYRLPSEKYTVAENLTLVESTGNSKVFSVKYNSHFYQEKIYDHC